MVCNSPHASHQTTARRCERLCIYNCLVDVCTNVHADTLRLLNVLVAASCPPLYPCNQGQQEFSVCTCMSTTKRKKLQVWRVFQQLRAFVAILATRLEQQSELSHKPLCHQALNAAAPCKERSDQLPVVGACVRAARSYCAPLATSTEALLVIRLASSLVCIYVLYAKFAVHGSGFRASAVRALILKRVAGQQAHSSTPARPESHGIQLKTASSIPAARLFHCLPCHQHHTQLYNRTAYSSPLGPAARAAHSHHQQGHLPCCAHVGVHRCSCPASCPGGAS